MGTLWQDLIFSVRMLRKSPAFTAIAVLTLSLGIGANTAIFSVVNGVLLRSMPYRAPGLLAIIWNDYGNQGQSLPAVSPPDFKDYRERSRTMEFAAAAPTGGGTLLLDDPGGGGNRPQQFDMANVTTNFFPLFGVAPALGRNFTAEEGALNGPKVVILSDRVWKNTFHADQGLIGKSISLNGNPFTVVGILPSQFRLLLPTEAFQIRDSDLWIPQQLDYTAFQRNLTFLSVFGRVKPEATMVQAQAEMDGIAEQLRNESEVHKESGLRIRVVPMQFDVVKNVRPTLITLLAAVGFVLLIACGNVANLLLARAARREREMAVRSALGASRGRLVRQIMSESVLLAVFGSLGGLLVAKLGLSLLIQLHPAGLPRLDDIHIDGSVLAFTLGACVFTALLFGWIPAVQALKLNLSDTLKDAARGSSDGRGQNARRLLVVSEFALSLVLLIGAGLLIRSFVALQRVEPGFRPQNIISFRVTIPNNRYPQNEDVSRFVHELELKMGAIPGVESVGSIFQLPFTGSGAQMPYAYNAETSQKWESLSADWRPITPGFFPTVGARLLEGRNFTDADDANHPIVVIVDDLLARRAWPGESAIGKKLEIESLSRKDNPRLFAIVVGVVAHLRVHDLTRDVREQIFIPHIQEPFGGVGVVLKVTGDPNGVTKQIAQQMRTLDPGIAIRNLQPLESYVDDARAPMRFNLILIGIFGAIALTLAAVGLYGVMAYSVTQRSHELGIRIAVGALPGDILRLVLGQGIRMTLLGAAIGLAVSLAVTRALSSLLFGVSTTDPVTFLVVPVVLAFVAVLACYLPARRAMRVDPIIALRYE